MQPAAGDAHRDRFGSVACSVGPSLLEAEGGRRWSPCRRSSSSKSRPKSTANGSGPRDGVRVGVEAPFRSGWDRYLGSEGGFVGMTGFGASGPAEALYQHFGITAEAIAAKARVLVLQAKRDERRRRRPSGAARRVGVFVAMTADVRGTLVFDLDGTLSTAPQTWPGLSTRSLSRWAASPWG